MIANNGKTIKKVSENTNNTCQIERTGLVEYGVIANLGSSSDVFVELGCSENPYGLGSEENASLEPWVSVASNDLDTDTTFYVKEMDGVKLPDIITHNDCIRVDDKSWSLDKL